MKKISKIMKLGTVFVFLLSLILIVVSQRYFSEEKFFAAFQISAVCLFGLCFLAEILTVTKQAKSGVQLRLIWMAFFILAVASYYLNEKALLSHSFAAETAHKYLSFQWVTCSILGLFTLAGIEISLATANRDQKRTRKAFLGFFSLGLLFSSFVWLNFANVKKNKTVDFSFLKTALPLDATQKIAANLPAKLDVVIFFPESNEVKSYVVNYFETLKKQPKLNIIEADKDLDPELAKEFQTSRNGQVVLRTNKNIERIDIGLSLNNARKILKNFDEEFQKAVLVLTAERRNIYFSTGHGELSWKTQDAEPLASLKGVEAMLRANNLVPRLWGSAEGSLREVPKDAAAVVIAGGSTSFLQEETLALKTYLQGGGSVLVYCGFDQGGERNIASFKSRLVADDPLYKMLKDFGFSYIDTPLADTTEFVRATQSPVDSWFLVSNQFSSHEAMTTLSHNDERLAVLVFKTGFLNMVSEIGSWSLTPLLKSLPSTFNDDDKNFQLTANSQEKRGVYNLVGVATAKSQDPKKAGKLLAFSSASMISDALIRNRGNMVLFADALKWSVGDMQRQGQTRTEEDVPIRHTKKQDLVYFYLTVIAMPLLILIAGYVATRRKRRVRGAV